MHTPEIINIAQSDKHVISHAKRLSRIRRYNALSLQENVLKAPCIVNRKVVRQIIKRKIHRYQAKRIHFFNIFLIIQRPAVLRILQLAPHLAAADSR